MNLLVPRQTKCTTFCSNLLDGLPYVLHATHTRTLTGIMEARNKTVNGVPVEAIVYPCKDDPELVERIANRKVKGPELAIVEPDSQWLNHFQTFRSRILATFEPHGPGDEVHQQGSGNNDSRVVILSINHIGSTSVPKLPAKAVIDIDLVLSSNSLSFEPFYVPRLEAAGFQFLLREPAWYEHRFFCASEPMS